MEYVFPESVVGGAFIGDAYVRFTYDTGTVTAQNDRETAVLEWLRSRGLCHYPTPPEVEA